MNSSTARLRRSGRANNDKWTARPAIMSPSMNRDKDNWEQAGSGRPAFAEISRLDAPRSRRVRAACKSARAQFERN